MDSNRIFEELLHPHIPRQIGTHDDRGYEPRQAKDEDDPLVLEQPLAQVFVEEIVDNTISNDVVIVIIDVLAVLFGYHFERLEFVLSLEVFIAAVGFLGLGPGG